MKLLSSFSPLLYVQISAERLRVRDVRAGIEISEPPQMAIAHLPKEKVLAVGFDASGAKGQSVEIVNPFGHRDRLFLTSLSASNCSKRLCTACGRTHC
jgi:rod shape-determining protein MreB